MKAFFSDIYIFFNPLLNKKITPIIVLYILYEKENVFNKDYKKFEMEI